MIIIKRDIQQRRHLIKRPRTLVQRIHSRVQSIRSPRRCIRDQLNHTRIHRLHIQPRPPKSIGPLTRHHPTSTHTHDPHSIRPILCKLCSRIDPHMLLRRLTRPTGRQPHRIGLIRPLLSRPLHHQVIHPRLPIRAIRLRHQSQPAIIHSLLLSIHRRHLLQRIRRLRIVRSTIRPRLHHTVPQQFRTILTLSAQNIPVKM